MKIFELTTGFIAAVMIALGANYYVNNNASVGEESVLNQGNLTESWFEYTGPNADQPGYDPLNRELYTIVDGNLEPSCSGNEQVCAIRTGIDDSDVNNPLPDQNDFDDLSYAIVNDIPDPNLKHKLIPTN